MKKIGKVVNTHGIRGEVRIMSNSDFKAIRFNANERLLIKGKGMSEEVTIEKYFTHKKFDVLKFKEYNNINEVLKFKGCDVYAPELSSDSLEDDEYFVEDLIGLEVYSTEDQFLGKVIDVNVDLPQSLIIIKNKKVKSFIPFLNEFVKTVDLESKKITIEVIPGLINED